MIEKIGGRKFVYAVIAICMAFAGWMLNKIDAQQFITFATAMGAIYVTGNVASKFSEEK